MLAAAANAATSVDHLLYYGASTKAKDGKGMTARDHAVKAGAKAALAVFDEELTGGAEDDAGAGGSAEAVDADGLTSTQRNKLKKRLMKVGPAVQRLLAPCNPISPPPLPTPQTVAQEAETKAVMTAISAAGGAGAAGGESDDETAAAAGTAAAGAGVNKWGVPPLPVPAPAPVWPELKTAVEEKRRELNVAAEGLPAAAGAGGGSGGAPAAGAGSAAEAEVVPARAMDPALWHAALLNTLSLRLPGLSEISPLIGHLTALTNLSLAGCGLTAIPETILALQELRHLDISLNALTALPDAVGRLPKLETLSLVGNKVATLAPLLPSTSLVSLLADGNELVDVVLPFATLPRLHTLSLSHNHITALPDEIGDAATLTTLIVSDNAITELPAGLANLNVKKIKELRLLPNPLADKRALKVINGDRPEKVSAPWGRGGGGGGRGVPCAATDHGVHRVVLCRWLRSCSSTWPITAKAGRGARRGESDDGVDQRPPIRQPQRIVEPRHSMARSKRPPTPHQWCWRACSVRRPSLQVAAWPSAASITNRPRRQLLARVHDTQRVQRVLQSPHHFHRSCMG